LFPAGKDDTGSTHSLVLWVASFDLFAVVVTRLVGSCKHIMVLVGGAEFLNFRNNIICSVLFPRFNSSISHRAAITGFDDSRIVECVPLERLPRGISCCQQKSVQSLREQFFLSQQPGLESNTSKEYVAPWKKGMPFVVHLNIR
jgi:hypothetical protein